MCLFSTSPGGETGRRKGLKILFPATGVRVQVPPRAPSLSRVTEFVDVRRAKVMLHADNLLRAAQLAVTVLQGLSSDEFAQVLG